MADYDFFELTGLPFDSSIKTTAKQVKTAIEKKKKDINSELAAGNLPQIKIGELKAQLQCLADYESAMLSSDSLSDEYTKLAKEREKKALDGLKATIDVMKKVGTRVVTNGTINAQKAISGLSKDTVAKAYTDAHIDIKQTKKLKEIWKSIKFNEQVFDSIAALRKAKRLNNEDLSYISDIYTFAAYMAEGIGADGAIYRAKTTSELLSLFSEFAQKLAGVPDDFTHLCADISSNAKTRIFKSDETRKEYDDYLLFRSPELTELFKSLKSFPAQNKIDPKFAESIIKKIAEVFGDADIALAIYNQEAGIENDPYEPVEPRFYVKCSYCQNLLEFKDLAEAQKTDKCAHCGKALYKTCNKCKKLVLVSLDKCPECSFVFASTAMFAKLFAAAEHALRRSDFEQARNNLFQAQSADPSEKTRTAELEARITVEEKRYEKPVNDLRKLVADKKFQRASEVLAETIGKFPGLNVTAFDSQINSALNNARTSFANSKRLTSSKQADTCLDILQQCADFKPAIDFLRATPPEPCKSFTVGLDSTSGNVNISWTRSSEQGVTYRVIRKQGEDIPANEVDGEVLLDNTTDASFRDKGVQPGRNYGYAAFAIRYGVYSSAVGKSIVLLADVTDAHCEQLDTTIRLTWNNPPNSTGVSIERTSEGATTTLTKNANGSYEDKGVEYGVAYTYRLCANYNGLSPSRGVELVITPMVKIDLFTIRAEQTKGNTYKVYWDIKRNGIDLRVIVDEKQYRELKSDARFCELALPAEGFHTITVLAYSGGTWLRSSNSPQVNTYSPCSIDKASSKLTEKPIVGFAESAYNIELHLKIATPIPANVVGFYYAVRTKTVSGEGAPWVEKQEIGTAADIRKVTLKTYQSSGEIVCTETAREENSYYVSLFTIYNFGGTEAVSNASKCRFDRPLTADLFWKVSKGGFGFGGYKLLIEITANRPFDRIPALVLCACGDGQHLLSYSDPKGQRIQDLPETKAKTLSQTYKGTFDISTSTALKGLKLFLFEASAVPNENFILRWTKGFSGKV